MAYEKQKAQEWLDRIQTVREPIGIVVTTHLYTEYALNHILLIKVPAQPPLQRLLEDLKFARKAKLAFDLGHIPKDLYDNLVRLNKLRNAFAHTLSVDFKEADLDFFDPERRVEVKKFHGTFDDPPTNEQICNVLGWVGVLTFGWLNNEIIKSLKSSQGPS